MGRALARLIALACLLVVGARDAQYDATTDEQDVESITQWHKDWKLWSGITLTLIGCCIQVCGGEQNVGEMLGNIIPKGKALADAILYLGLDLMILSVTQRNRVAGFIGIMAVIILQSVIMCFYQWLQLSCNIIKIWPKEATEVEMEASNVFLDLPNPFAESFVRFLGQTMLMGYYWHYVFTVSKFDNLVFWLATLPVQLLAKHQMGRSYQDSRLDWLRIFSSCRYRMSDKESMQMNSSLELNMRCLQAWIVNHVYYQSLILSVPLMLMQSETGIDFVKDAFAVMFIPTLDELSTPRKLTLIRTGNSLDPQASDPESGALVDGTVDVSSCDWQRNKSEISELHYPLAA